MNNKPTVSAAICTYNGEKYIYEQLNSIICQSELVDEIIICDDGSSDNTLNIAESILKDSGIPYHIEVNRNNLGTTKNFEKCISLCKCEIIITADQDDLWNHNKVEKMISVFEEHEDCVLVFSDAQVIDSDGNQLFSSLCKKDGFMQNGITFDSYIDDILRLSFTVYGCTMAFKKEFVNKIMPFYISKANHDAWIMCCAGFFGTVHYIPEQLISYRIHSSNQVGSIAGNKQWDSIIEKQDAYDKHFVLHDLRSLRVKLISEALLRFPLSNEYTKQCKKLVNFYTTIVAIKSVNRMQRIFRFIYTVLNSSYKYRICDRGRSLSNVLLFKQFLYDVVFLWKWSKSDE